MIIAQEKILELKKSAQAFIEEKIKCAEVTIPHLITEIKESHILDICETNEFIKQQGGMVYAKYVDKLNELMNRHQSYIDQTSTCCIQIIGEDTYPRKVIFNEKGFTGLFAGADDNLLQNTYYDFGVNNDGVVCMEVEIGTFMRYEPVDSIIQALTQILSKMNVVLDEYTRMVENLNLF